MVTFLVDAFRLLRAALDKFNADGCARGGAALAYYSLFSLFPLLLLLISGLSYLLACGVPLVVDARTFVLHNAGRTLPQAEDLLERSIAAALKVRGSTGIAGLLTLLWSASNMFSQLYYWLNVIWGSSPTSGIWAAIRTKLIAVGVVLAITLLLLVSIVLNMALGVAVRYARTLLGWELAWRVLSPLYLATMATIVLTLLYRYLPNTRVPWRQAWPGALLAGTAWELLREVFTIYATRTNYVAVYGAVGSTIALLSWIYLSAQILLFGAEFSVVYWQSHCEARARSALSRGYLPE